MNNSVDKELHASPVTLLMFTLLLYCPSPNLHVFYLWYTRTPDVSIMCSHFFFFPRHVLRMQHYYSPHLHYTFTSVTVNIYIYIYIMPFYRHIHQHTTAATKTKSTTTTTITTPTYTSRNTHTQVSNSEVMWTLLVTGVLCVA